ncbi:MAG: phosphoesterase [Planctomycetota bacterium]
MPAEEHVLCIPTPLFHELGRFDGFSADIDRYRAVFDIANTSFLPRSKVEPDPSFKQLIPYCVIACGGEVFHYRRHGGGEGRLDAKRSVGVGGHISSEDADGGAEPYVTGLRRELAEEVDLGDWDDAWADSVIGLINDDTTDVGAVHLGIVHLLRVENPKVSPREATMTDVGFARPQELLASGGEFETWSQICLEHLASAGSDLL